MVAAKAENATGGANFYVVRCVFMYKRKFFQSKMKILHLKNDDFGATRGISAAVVHEFPHVKIQALAVSTTIKVGLFTPPTIWASLDLLPYGPL